MTVRHHQPPNASARRTSCHFKAQCSPARTLERDNLRGLWPMHRPCSMGQRRQICQCQADHDFWQGVFKNWGDDETLCDLHRWCHPGGVSTLAEVHGRINLGTNSSGDPSGSHHWGASPSKGAHWGVGACRGTHWRTSCPNGPAEEPTVELAISMATVRELAEGPYIPLCGMRREKKGRFHVATSLAGWRCCILPDQWSLLDGPLWLLASWGSNATATMWGKKGPALMSQRMQAGCTGGAQFDIVTRVPRAWTGDSTSSRL